MIHEMKNLLNTSLKHAGIEKQVAASLALEDYMRIILEIFGKKITNQAKPLYLKNGVLSVACENSVVAQELKFREGEILGKINKRQKIINRIRYLL